MFDRKENQILSKGTGIYSGAPKILSVKLLYSLAVLFENLACVSEAYVALVAYSKPDSSKELPHLLVQIRMVDDSKTSYQDLLQRTKNVITKGNFGQADKPVDIMQIGVGQKQEEPLKGSQLFFKSENGKTIPL